MNVSTLPAQALLHRPQAEERTREPARARAGLPVADPDLRRTRLAQVLRYDILANLAGLALLLGMHLTVTPQPEILLLGALVAAHLLQDIWLYRCAGSWDGVRVVAVCAAGIWVVTIIVTLIVPAVVVVMTITALVPAVLAVPYLTRSSLRILVAGLVSVTTILTFASRHPVDHSLGQAAPAWLVSAVLITFVPVMTGGIVLLLWHNNAWLQEALDAAGKANGELLESRRQVEDQAAQLRASRERVVAAADAERRRMERDLHDGAQQSLAAAGSPLRTRVTADGVARYPAELEAAAYFCCLEAIQNSVKHAGPKARANVRLTGGHRELACAITDTGSGFDVGSQTRPRTGHGLTNLADRAAAAGGQADVESVRGRGTTVRLRFPVAAGRTAAQL